jgi:hypothetical protein
MAEINEILIRLNIQGGDEATTQIGNLDKAIRQLDATYKLMKNSTDVNSEALGKNRTEVKALEQEKNRLLKTTVGTIQSQEAEEGSLTQLRIALSKATAEYNRMGEVKRNSVKGKELETSIINQTQAISALEQKMGNFRRNVGNYASGWNGLSNSINQVTRELPNFAQSATIGFMALSNNLPILVDEINRVRVANQLLAADGQKTTSVFKQIATSIFGWQSALITVISLSVMYGKEIGNFITGTKEATKVTKERKTAQDELNESMKNFATLLNPKNYQSLQEVMQMLRGENNRALVSTNELRNALANLNTQMNNLKIFKTEVAGVEISTQRDIDHYNAIKKSITENIALIQQELNIREGKTKTTKESADKEIEENDKVYESVRNNFQDEIDANRDFYTKRENLIKASFERGLIDKKTYEDEVYKLTEQRILREIELQRKYNIPTTSSVSELESLRIGGLEKSGKFEDAAEKERNKQKEIEDKNRQLLIDASIQAAKQTVDAISKIKQDALDRELKRELTAIQRNADGQDRILENRLRNGIISEAQYNASKQNLNEETAAKELEANRKAFEEKKRLDTATAIANGALAITSILAQYPKFDYGIAAAIAIGAATATTATQVAVIQAQKFALGGKVNGKSHAEGGVMIEAEGGEGMINKNSMRSQQVMQAVGTPSQIASAINMSGGGVSWEQGATLRPNPNMFNNNSSSNYITFAQMSGLIQDLKAGINDKKVVMLESDVTKTQKRVKAYENASRF